MIVELSMKTKQMRLVYQFAQSVDLIIKAIDAQTQNAESTFISVKNIVVADMKVTSISTAMMFTFH